MAAAASPACPKCRGRGWIIHERDGISAAERCSCMIAARASDALEQAQIPLNYRQRSFEDFNVNWPPIPGHQLGNSFQQARRYVDDFPANPKPGLMWIGGTGTGKTHLAVAVLKALIRKGFSGLFFDYQNLLERIRSSYNETSGASDREAYRSALEAEILLLDDFGAHRVTDWVEDTVTSIITWRCNHQKPTLITTNLADPDAGASPSRRNELGGVELRDTIEKRVGPRARSRLFEMCKIIRMPAIGDYRVRPNPY
jgi:DNA replication protein DnaC